MTSPANYDSAKVKVDPNSLWTLANSVETSRQAMLGHVQTIFNTLAALTTGWNSDSSQQAHAFAQQLGAACDDVFGSDGSDGATTSSGPPAGVLNQYKAFLQAAADAFDDTESQASKSWSDFNDRFTSSGGGDQSGDGSINDATRTAVTYDTVGP